MRSETSNLDEDTNQIEVLESQWKEGKWMLREGIEIVQKRQNRSQ